MKTLVSVLGLALAGLAHGEGLNTVRPGVLINPIATGFSVDYERMLNDRMSAGVRFANISYEFEDGRYTEDGDVKGVDLMLRFYPQGKGFSGLYWGLGAGRYSSDWTWTEPGSSPAAGNGTSKLWNVSATVGYKHFFSRNVYVDGYAVLGNWSGKSTESTGTKETEVGGYAGVGAGLGFTF